MTYPNLMRKIWSKIIQDAAPSIDRSVSVNLLSGTFHNEKILISSKRWYSSNQAGYSSEVQLSS
jgi:hypothetical protein